MTKLFRLWRFLLPFLFLFVLIHFLKDITQDIIGVKTPLDIFGDAQEDLSGLDQNMRYLYFYGLGGLSLFVEGFLLVAMPIIWKRKTYTKLEKYVLIITTSLLLFFFMAIMLDPKYRPF